MTNETNSTAATAALGTVIEKQLKATKQAVAKAAKPKKAKAKKQAKGKARAKAQSKAKAKPVTARTDSKQARFIAAMRTAKGMSIDEAAEEFGWQIAHGARRDCRRDQEAPRPQGRVRTGRQARHGLPHQVVTARDAEDAEVPPARAERG